MVSGIRARATLVIIVLGAALLFQSAAAELQWREVEGTRIPIPPAEHPRLYLRGEHVKQFFRMVWQTRQARQKQQGAATHQTGRTT